MEKESSENSYDQPHLVKDSYNFFQSSNLHKRSRKDNSLPINKVPRLVSLAPTPNSFEAQQRSFLQQSSLDKFSLRLDNKPKKITKKYKIELLNYIKLNFYLIDLELTNPNLTQAAFTALNSNNKVLRHLLNNGNKVNLKEFYKLLSLIDPKQRQRFFELHVYPLLTSIDIKSVPSIFNFTSIPGISTSLTINSSLPICDKIIHFVKFILLFYKNNVDKILLTQPQFKKIYFEYQPSFLYHMLWKGTPIKTFEQWSQIISNNDYLYKEAIIDDLEKKDVSLPSLILNVDDLPAELSFSTNNQATKLQVLILINKFMNFYRKDPDMTIYHSILIQGTGCHLKTINYICWNDNPITHYAQFVSMIVDNYPLFLAAITLQDPETVDNSLSSEFEVSAENAESNNDEELFNSMLSFSVPEEILERCSVKATPLTEHQRLTFFSQNLISSASSPTEMLALDPLKNITDDLFPEINYS